MRIGKKGILAIAGVAYLGALGLQIGRTYNEVRAATHQADQAEYNDSAIKGLEKKLGTLRPQAHGLELSLKDTQGRIVGIKANLMKARKAKSPALPMPENSSIEYYGEGFNDYRVLVKHPFIVTLGDRKLMEITQNGYFDRIIITTDVETISTKPGEMNYIEISDADVITLLGGGRVPFSVKGMKTYDGKLKEEASYKGYFKLCDPDSEDQDWKKDAI